MEGKTKHCKLKCKIRQRPDGGCEFDYYRLRYIKEVRNGECERKLKAIQKSLR